MKKIIFLIAFTFYAGVANSGCFETLKLWRDNGNKHTVDIFTDEIITKFCERYPDIENCKYGFETVSYFLTYLLMEDCKKKAYEKNLKIEDIFYVCGGVEYFGRNMKAKASSIVASIFTQQLGVPSSPNWYYY